MRILVIGGGIFGTTISYELCRDGHDVVLVEKNDKILQKASKVNHNRVHFGYHYPRSQDTARQCLDSLPSFLMDYRDAVVDNFENYYAISKHGSHVTSQEFESFCDDVKIDYKEGYPSKKLLDREQLQASYLVREPVFDFSILERIVQARLNEQVRCDVRVGSAITSVSRKNERFLVRINDGEVETFDKVINCSYSGLNEVNKLFGVKPLELRFERTVVPMFEFNHPKIGLTVMDGPFCTIMPYGNTKNHFLLWHVDGCLFENATDVRNIEDTKINNSDIQKIYEMSSKFMPFMRKDNYKHHLFQETIKTVFENKYDARMSEIQGHKEYSRSDGSHDYFTVLSGKIMCSSRIARMIKQFLSGKEYKGAVLV